MDKRPYYPALDGLRAIAVLGVFSQHYLASFLPEWLRFGWAGVDVFFVLSGFLITGILFDSRHAPHRWRDFYVRRTLRIFPLYYGILLLVLVTTPLAHWQLSLRWLSFPLYYFNLISVRLAGYPPRTLGNVVGVVHQHTYVNLIFYHFWTLCVEEQFYLVWPAVVFLVKDRKLLLQLICGAVPVVLVLRCLLMLTHFGQQYPERLVRATYDRFDSLLFGAAVALLLRGPAAIRVMRWGSGLLLGGLAALIVAGCTAVFALHQPASADPESKWVLSFGFTCTAAMGAGLLLLAMREGTGLSRLLQWPALRWLGQRSYGFYVFHMIPIQIAAAAALKLVAHRRPGATNLSPSVVLLQALLGFLFTIVITPLSYTYFEQPFLRMIERWTRRPPEEATRQILQEDVVGI